MPTPPTTFTGYSHPAIRPFWRSAGPALVYIVICIVYIMVSGRLAADLARDPRELQVIEQVKGVVFVVVSGLVFFAMAYRHWRMIRKQEEVIFAQQKGVIQGERRQIATLFAAATAHDLNNFLMSLYGLVDELKILEEDHPSLAPLRAQVNRGMDRLLPLARRVADAAGEMGAHRMDGVDLRAALQDLLDLARMHPEVRMCDVSLVAGSAPTLALNRALLESAVLNLLVNAAQAAGVGGKVEIRLATEAGDVRLEVHDNGPGVPESFRDEVFEAWFSTKSEGTGLGLVSVKLFASTCGGEATVGDSPLGGACFAVRIPRAT